VTTDRPAAGPLPPPPPGKSGWPWTDPPAVLPPVMPDGSPWPRLSIVTPSFNQGAFIEETIRSVLLQGYPDLEYLILDAGSTDGTLDVIRKYERHLTWWVSEPDRGQSDAINKGFARCTGELMNWLNSDDWLAPGALAAVVAAARRDPEAGAYVGTSRRVTARGKAFATHRRSAEEVNNPLDWMKNHFSQPATYFRRSVWDQVGPVDLALRYAMDVDLWVRAARVCRFAVLPEVIAYDREHSSAKTTGERPQMYGELVVLQVRHGGLEYVRRDVTELQATLMALVNSPVYRAVKAVLPTHWLAAVRRWMKLP
jgi:glycosyltransferase involved in cell wall biosynthesis